MSDAPSDGKLQLTRHEMQALGYQIVDLLVEHFENLPNKPVTRRRDRATLENKLREPLPEKGTEIAKVIEQIQEDVFNNIMHLDHPRCFAFVPSPSNFVSVMADALASGFNVFAGTWLEGSSAAEIELVTIDWLRQLFGLPEEAGGLFVSGGSIANLTALATARHVKLNDQIQNAVVYYSDQTHSSIARALKILGFAPEQLGKIESNDRFCLPLAELQERVASDRAMGKVPFCVVANAGTTNTGAVDPLPELAEFCRQQGLWLHADGAYGAAAILCDEGRSLLKGLELVDSLTLDPHKWLFQPYEIGCLLVRDRAHLKDTFYILPEYLQDVEHGEEEVNFCNYGIQLTRSFRALKLWMSFKVFGVEAFRQAVAKGIALAELTEKLLYQLSDWEVVTPAQLGIITFRYVPFGCSDSEIDGINHQLVDRIIADGSIMLSTTVLKGRTVLRMCTINPRTTEEDIRDAIDKFANFGQLLVRK
jgi:glutamate/tyrosine decarboxylase-like PLP-dependent enzyme